MALVIMDSEVLRILEAKKALFVAEMQAVYLYTNDYTPTPADSIGNYVAATFPGSGGIALNWSASPMLTGSGSGRIEADAVIWTPVMPFGAQDCYGYYVVRSTPFGIAWAERFVGAAISVGGSASPFTLIPYFGERSIPG